MGEDRDRARQAEAKRLLDRIADESEVVGTSRLGAAGRRLGQHLSPEDRAGDRIELWGTRVGRALGLAALVALAVYLFVTYIAA